MMTYPDSVEFLYSLGNEIKTMKLGLERITRLLEGLGNPQESCQYVHVAGTNGKGSTCAMVESALRAAGIRTALYTSPHLVEPTERIRIGAGEVSRDDFAWAFRQVHDEAVKMMDAGRLDAHPTYFETVTAMAFVLFQRHAVQTAVLEVGLGGRLDATNVVKPAVCVITPVDYDHEAWLGNSLRSIAGEKAGIIKKGVPVVFARQHEEALGRLNEAAAERSAPVRETAEWTVQDLALDKRGSRFKATGPRTVQVECPLAGEHQVENALAALTALDALGVDTVAMERGIKAARWPGRLERVRERPEIILDGAHNPAGVRALAAYIARFYQGRRVWVIFGSMRDKSIDEIADVLSPVAAEVILTAAESSRALRPDTLRALFPHTRVRTAERLAGALAITREAAPEDAIFITGSLLLVGEARALLVR